MTATQESTRLLSVRKRRRSRRLRLSLTICGILGIGLFLNSYLALRPARLEEQVRRYILEVSGGALEVRGEVSVDWRRGIHIQDLAYTAPDQKSSIPSLNIRLAHIKPRSTSLALGQFDIEEVTLIEPRLSLVVGSDGIPIPLEFPEGSLLSKWLSGTLQGETSKNSSFPLPRLNVREGALLFRSDGSQNIRQDFLDIDLDVDVQPQGLMHIRGKARTPFVDQIGIVGTWDPGNAGLNVAFDGARISLAHPLRGIIPEGGEKWIQELDLQGRVDLQGSLSWKPGSLPQIGNVKGSILEGHLRVPHVLGALERIKGRFSLEGNQIEFSDIESWVGTGKVSGTGRIHWDSEWTEIQSYRVDLKGEGLSLDSRWGKWLPSHLQKYLERVHLRGRFNFDLKTSVPPEQVPSRLLLSFTEGEFLHRDFPLAYSGLQGKVRVSEDKVEIVQPLTLSRESSKATLTGWMGVSKDNPQSKLDLIVESLPLDDDLRSALPADWVTYWRELNPAGKIDLVLEIQQKGVDSAPSKKNDVLDDKFAFTLRAVDTQITPQRFPFPISHINGKVEMDRLTHTLKFLNLKGEREGQVFTANGELNYEKGAVGEIEIKTPSLALDSELVKILPPEGQSLIQDFGLSGRSGVTLNLYSRLDEELQSKLTFDIQDLSVNFSRFPMPLRFRSGKMIRDTDGSFRIEKLKTAEAGLAMGTVDGTLSQLGGQRRLSVDLDIQKLSVDDDFPRYLPSDLQRVVKQLKLKGTLTGKLNCEVDYDRDRPQNSRVSYKAREVTTKDLSVDFGLLIQGIQATGEFKGGRDFSQGHAFRGKATVQSSKFNRLSFGKTDLEFSFARELEQIRKLRTRPQPIEGQEPYGPKTQTISQKLLQRFQLASKDRLFQVWIKSSELYGGKLEGFLGMDSGVRRDLNGEFWAEDVQIQKSAIDVFKLKKEQQHEVDGKAEGFIQFSGIVGEIESIGGQGEVHVREAKLGKLPLFVSFINRLFSLKAKAMPHFKQVDLNFAIRDQKFESLEAEGITIRADGLDLLGYGSLDFAGKLNMTLKPQILDWKLPIIDSVFDLLKRLLLRIRVEGTLENPTTTVLSGAGLLKVDVTPESSSSKEDK